MGNKDDKCFANINSMNPHTKAGTTIIPLYR